MKKVIRNTIGILAALSLSIAFASAKTPPTIKNKTELDKAIRQVVKYTEDVKEKGACGTVEVIFQVNNHGKVEIKASEGNDILESHVCENLENLNIENPELYGRFFTKKFTFKVYN